MSVRRPIKAGYLWKENDFGLVRKEWRRRFFILESGMLRFYDEEPKIGRAMAPPRGVIPLEGANAGDTKHARTGKLAFRLNVVPRPEQKAHKLIMAADTLEEVWVWMDAFKQAGVTISFQAAGMASPRTAAAPANPLQPMTSTSPQRSQSGSAIAASFAARSSKLAAVSSTKRVSSTKSVLPPPSEPEPSVDTSRQALLGNQSQSAATGNASQVVRSSERAGGDRAGQDRRVSLGGEGTTVLVDAPADATAVPKAHPTDGGGCCRRCCLTLLCLGLLLAIATLGGRWVRRDAPTAPLAPEWAPEWAEEWASGFDSAAEEAVKAVREIPFIDALF